MYVVTSIPLVRRTRATLRIAEFGFFGVVVYTRVHTPRFCGEAFNAGTLLFVFCAERALRTSWLVVAIQCFQIKFGPLPIFFGIRALGSAPRLTLRRAWFAGTGLSCARKARNFRLRASPASTKDDSCLRSARRSFLHRCLRRRRFERRGLCSRGCRLGGLGLQRLLQLELLELGRQDVLLRTAAFLVVGIARAGRDQPPHNHVLLQAAQVVAHAAHGRLG